MAWNKIPLKSEISVNAVYTAFVGEYKDGFTFAGEAHNFWEIVMVKKGFVWVAEEERITKLYENMFVIHKPMAFHRIWCDGSDTDVRIMSFDADGALSERLYSLSGKCDEITAKLYYEINSLGGRLLRDESLDEDEKRIISGQVSSGMESLLYKLMKSEVLPNIKLENTDAQHILNVINQHYTEKLSLEKIAEYCHMSESKIKKDFRVVYDGGIMKYVCRLKIRDAADMLKKGESIERICERLSFGDKNYFSFVFKRETGETPIEYRKKTQGY